MPTYQESGWNPNGGDLAKDVCFGIMNRVFNNWYSTTNVPTVNCPNEVDRFSVSSSIAHLNYPVGLLTIDEIVMAGASGNSGVNNTTYYLRIGDYYWSMSPYNSQKTYASEGRLSSNGFLSGSSTNASGSVRPVVSLNSSVEFVDGGNGTPTNPYVVKYN